MTKKNFVSSSGERVAIWGWSCNFRQKHVFVIVFVWKVNVVSGKVYGCQADKGVKSISFAMDHLGQGELHFPEFPSGNGTCG